MEGESTSPRKTVVVAMDGSKESEQAFEFYVKNIYKENDEVVVFYCVHHRAQHTYGSIWMPVEPHVVVHAYHEENKKADALCEKLQEKIDTYQIGAKVKKIEGGDPGHTIVEKAKEVGANLIVVGCRGLGTIRRKIMGSVSEYILHHSDVPVFVCRH